MRAFHPPRPALVATLILLPVLAQAETPAPKGAGPSPDAVAACERAARQSLAPQTDRPADVTFTAAPTLDASLSGDSLVVLRGAGRWRSATGPRSFTYSCNIDPRNAESVGLVMRDTTPPGSAAAAPRPQPEPDLSHLSPAACESGAAAALKRRWPNVSQISFDSATRSLQQETPGKAELRGQGRAMPGPGQPTTIFRFDCEIDPRDGRVQGVRVSG
jgi:hypothetical protein